MPGVQGETMISYTTCARAGCTNRVAYNVIADDTRHRYCPHCEFEVARRLEQSGQCGDMDIMNALMIKVVK